MSFKEKKILITFGRSFLTLALARQLHNAGHKVYLTDSISLHVCRFSNAVEKNFKVPSPRFHPEAYIQEMIKIVEREKIDFLIPVYEEISYLAKAKDLFPSFCQIFSPSFELFDQLHNKWKFHEKLEELGIEAIKTSLVRNKEDFAKLDFTTPFALKACYTRASQSVKKIIPNQKNVELNFEAHNPFVAQQWLEGHRFCTYSICHDGKIHAHGVYPVRYAIDGNSCLTFESIEHPEIFNWIANFVNKVNFTGQIAFDFIETADQKLYAIECNPRATSGLLLFSRENGLGKAFFKEHSSPLFPTTNARQQIASGMLMFGWKKSALPNNTLLKFLKDFIKTKDVVFCRRDLKPFIFEPLSFIRLWLKSKKHKVSIADSFTYDHEWNGEVIK